MEWTKENVIQKMEELRDKGFIRVPADMFRKDDGIVGQILEREFGVAENNLHLADLGTYELKGMRKKKNKASTLTLFHQTSTAGLTPNQIFDRFSYEKPSQRDGSLKRKLFTTIYGNKVNSLGFILRGNGDANVDLFFKDILINITDAWIDGKRVPLHINIINAMRAAGYEFRNTIIWDRRNLVNKIGIFGWPSSYITMGTTFEYILDFTLPAPPKKTRAKSKEQDV